MQMNAAYLMGFGGPEMFHVGDLDVPELAEVGAGLIALHKGAVAAETLSSRLPYLTCQSVWHLKRRQCLRESPQAS
jgi:hypothetical protein